MKKSKFNVEGMHCNSCETLLKEELEEKRGIRNVEASAKKGVVIVTHNTNIISDEEIIEFIKLQGYKVW